MKVTIINYSPAILLSQQLFREFAYQAGHSAVNLPNSQKNE